MLQDRRFFQLGGENSNLFLVLSHIEKEFRFMLEIRQDTKALSRRRNGGA